MKTEIKSHRLLAAVMFIDMVGYTVLMEENEAYAIHLRAQKRRILKHQIENHSGAVVQYYGDGALCIFRSAFKASLCAMEIQAQVRSCSIPVRIGIHLGEIVRDQEGIYGHAVNVAARLESLATAGGILISDKVFEEVKNHPEIRTSALGTFSFKHVNSPMQVYALNLENQVLHCDTDRVRHSWDEQLRQRTSRQLVLPVLRHITEGLIN